MKEFCAKDYRNTRKMEATIPIRYFIFSQYTAFAKPKAYIINGRIVLRLRHNEPLTTNQLVNFLHTDKIINIGKKQVQEWNGENLA